ncbi:hypothetical protein [Psychrosphaera algicola]|uniref:Energy transducer TonB n=1 Tax=Psychrosphaera algicola TaxID=3023714 RepID=A0ABT5FFG1_9GAMM|nr:hypothetical protein [Psychrosphaera sp. G1-22]MDC2890295.1 hypothetical protein [Psychrosphaera sp. G1-22]
MNQATTKIAPEIKSIGKFTAFTLLGATACFALFVLMGKLIENDNLSFAEPRETFITELLAVQEEKPTIVKPNVLPPPPIAKAPPPPPPIPVDTTSENLLAMNTNFGIKIPLPNLALLCLKVARTTPQRQLSGYNQDTQLKQRGMASKDGLVCHLA